ncbi:PIN-like domain-containing protein [Pantoea endophytica]|uniref:PIN-like domain-containing protein n=1 Tax=Pantoea endophytica TaxID=92488 RepID=UPI00289B0A13|nr:PIN-like domain-containing protein [Pantoea endophytica]
MKSVFFGFYSIDDTNLKNIWQADSTLFVFDTNCLFNLYRCEDHTRDDILNVMSKISSRIWIPFQVGFEYQRNRRTVIEESINSLDKIRKELEKIYTQNIISSSGIQKHLYNNLSDEITELQESLKKPIDDYITQKIAPRIESKKSISEHDIIRDRIDLIIKDKVGAAPDQSTIEKINEEGKLRYAAKQAPGFMDDVKKEVSFFSKVEFQDKYGDLYLWKEIITKAKSDDIKNVIFVCDDNKNDWWYKKSGKTHGVLESLKTEICKEADIENFKIINQLTFLHEAKSYLDNIIIRPSSFKEVEELSQVTYPDYEKIFVRSRHADANANANGYISESMMNDRYDIYLENNDVEKDIASDSIINSNIKNRVKRNTNKFNFLKHRAIKLLLKAEANEDELQAYLTPEYYNNLITDISSDVNDLDELTKDASYLIINENLSDIELNYNFKNFNRIFVKRLTQFEGKLSMLSSHLQTIVFN